MTLQANANSEGLWGPGLPASAPTPPWISEATGSSRPLGNAVGPALKNVAGRLCR